MEKDGTLCIPWPGWRIVRRLGSGGFGTVYEIERELYGDKERAAMKVIRIPENASELEEDYNSGMTEDEIRKKYDWLQNYLVNEYRQMLEVKGHSNIVNCHDFSVIPNTHQPGCTIYIRMELLTPLTAELQKEGFSESKIIRLGIDICQALEVCERKDIIHRDIKPDNILVSEFGNFKLGDFGLARAMEKTMSASKAGTCWYMAPEVAKKMKYGKSADTYALGLVLYWIMNHYRLPFVPVGKPITVKEMEYGYRLRMQGKEIPEPAGGSQGLKAIVLKAVSYDREQRYRSAMEMLQDLRSLEKPAKGTEKPKEKRQEEKRQEEKKPAQAARPETAGRNGAFGIYFDAREIHVRLWMAGQIRSVLRIPAVYTFDSLKEALTGSRAVIYQRCHREKKLYSVLRAMKIADRDGSSSEKKEAEEICCALMRELKRNLEETANWYGGLKECVITVTTSELTIQRSVHNAMEEAGFRVLRQLNTAVACAVSLSYSMTKEQKFAVCVTADGERQSVTAVYEADCLEITENTTESVQTQGAGKESRRWDYCAGVLHWNYDADDETYRRELSDAAAGGAALQGAKLRIPMKDSVLLLDYFPWRVGLEIAAANRNICVPLTWAILERETIPAKSKPIHIRLDSGIQGKCLRLYIGSPGSGKRGRMIWEWDLGEWCKGFGTEMRELEAVVWLGMDIPSIEIGLKRPGMKENLIILDSLQRGQRKTDTVPLTTAFVPKQILRDVWKASEKFSTDAEMLKYVDSDPAILQGIQKIARQNKELFDGCQGWDTELRIDSFLEKVLTIADNLEYGLKAVDKMDCRSEQMLLSYFYKKLRDNLHKLNLTPIEAEGRRFDPYLHYAMMEERAEGVESGMITEEIQKGYLRGTMLYRPARVKVAK